MRNKALFLKLLDSILWTSSSAATLRSLPVAHHRTPRDSNLHPEMQSNVLRREARLMVYLLQLPTQGGAETSICSRLWLYCEYVRQIK